MGGRLRMAALLGALVLTTAACDWTMLGFGAGRTSYSAFEHHITPANASQLHELWHTDIGTPARAPVAADGKVFTLGGVAGGVGALRAYDAATGGCTAPGTCTPKWSQPLRLWGSTPVISGRSVFAGGYEFVITHPLPGYDIPAVSSVGGGFDLDTGVPTTSGSASAQIVTGDGSLIGWEPKVFFMGSPKPYYSLQLVSSTPGVTSAVLWEAPSVGVTSGGTVSVVDGLAFVGNGSGVSVLPARGGCGIAGCPTLWTTALTSTPTWESLPVVDKGFVFVSEMNGSVEAFTTAGCNQIPNGHCPATWTAHAGSVHLSGVAVSDTTLFVGSDDGHLDAFPATGCGAAVCEPSWSVDLGTAVHNPSVAGGSVFAPTDDGRVAVIDAHGCGAATCSPAWVSSASGSPARWAPVVADGRVFVVDDTGRMRVFGLPA